MNAVVNAEIARFNMIEQQIRPWDVLDTHILALLNTVPREQFVPSAHQALAFSDLEIPLLHPAAEGQCMLAPRVEARLLQDLQIKPTDHVLEIGTGSGYMAALLAHLARRVTTVEINQTLAANARDTLESAKIQNVDVILGDGSQVDTWRKSGPFDVIVLSGSVAALPMAWLEFLKPGGRLVGIAGQKPVMCATFVTKDDNDSSQTTTPWDTVAPRLMGFPEPSKFSF